METFGQRGYSLDCSKKSWTVFLFWFSEPLRWKKGYDHAINVCVKFCLLGEIFIKILAVFIESAHSADSVIELQCPCVCMSVCRDVVKHPFRSLWRFLVKGHIANIGMQWHNLLVLCFDDILSFSNFRVFFEVILLWASLLWIMGELAGGGSVAVGVSDRCHIKVMNNGLFPP